VVAKNAEPNTESANVKLAWLYSTYCKNVNTNAKIIVIKRPLIEAFLSFAIKAWCA
jgi:hypothetical protein